MALINLREEIYKRKKSFVGLTDLSHNQAEDIDRLVGVITQQVTSDHGELVNDVSCGKKPVGVLENVVRKAVVELGATINVTGSSTMDTVGKVLDGILGYGVLQPLVDDPDVTDIFVNGPQNVYKRVRSRDVRIPNICWRNATHLEHYIRWLMVRCDRKLHFGIPPADARDIKNRIRLNAGIPPVAKTPYLAIRKHTCLILPKKIF